MNNQWKKSPFAKILRHKQTNAEQFLWSKLRNRQVAGVKFRRQEPIGNYIVDFISVEKKLIIEVDGSQHLTDEGMIDDMKRTKWLQEQGYTMLRFYNNEVLKDINAVVEFIYATLTHSPSPKGRGKREENSMV